MLVLTGAEIRTLLDLDELRAGLATAMRDVSGGRASMPARIAAVAPERGLLAAMSAYVPSIGGLAAKLVSLFPGNAGTGVPTHQAVVVVFDTDTGRPLALLDGTSITTARTAAGSALSADLLAVPDARTLAILGNGVQARAHAHAMVRVRPIRAIRVAGRDRQRATTLAAELQAELHIDVQSRESYAAACADADIVCAATHSPAPVVHRDALRPGVHITSVGYNTAGRELDLETVVDSVLVVESRDAVLAPPPAGSPDLLVPIEAGIIGPEHIHAEIGELLSGARPGRTSADQITLYKSVGIAAQDAVAADLVVTAARSAGVGVEVDL